jgi:hypothetical protein
MLQANIRRSLWPAPRLRPPRRSALALLPACLCAGLAASGCGTTTIDNKKAESLIRSATGGQGHETPSQISCPSGVKAKKAATFVCQVSYADGTKGTVTEHIASDSGRVEVSPADLHLTSGPGAQGGSTGGSGGTSSGGRGSGGTGSGGTSTGSSGGTSTGGASGGGSSGSSGGSGGGGY